MKGTIRSEQFDDVYFSADDGLAETEHVFLRGNNLPERFKGHDIFTICETGFGTGLNFLAVWKLFDENKEQGQVLRFISFEKYPLSRDVMLDALSPWGDILGDRVDIMLEAYPDFPEGEWSCKLPDNVELVVYFCDVNDVIEGVSEKVDCWFLDGFTPSKNPAMWSECLFKNMKRLSSNGCTFSTFTAAGIVKRGLLGFGFNVNKRDGFGRKRDMLCGDYIIEGNTK